MYTLKKVHVCVTLLALLVSCNTKAPRPVYAVTHVIENPSTVGAEVSLYGHFPSDPALLLDDQPLPYRVFPEGVVVQIPTTTLAGLHPLYLKVDSDKLLLTQLELRPQIGSVTQEGLALRIQGVGWMNLQAFAQGIQVELQGQWIPPTSVTSQGILVPLPKDWWAGNHAVRVQANGKISASKSLTIQAATVSGSVIRPLAPLQNSVLMRQTLGRETKTILIQTQESGCESTPTNPAFLEIQKVPEMHAIKVQYENHDQAEQGRSAWESLACVNSTEYDDGLSLQQDPFPAQQGAIEDLGKQWFWERMGLTESPALGGQGVTVAVLDTGVVVHEEFRDNLLPGKNFLNTVNGRPTDDTTDQLGHGTHVTGLIVAHKQLISPAPQARILPLKVTERSGSVIALAQAILYAVNELPGTENPYPADVISMSLGQKDYSPTLADAVRTALSKGAVLVAATGNNSDAVNHPAALPGVIGVTAVAGPVELYQPAYAVYGLGTRLTAYGGEPSAGVDQDRNGIKDQILSTDLLGYSLRSGTSMATPQVSGLAALLLSQGVSREKLVDTLTHTTTDIGAPGKDLNFGAGLIHFLSKSSDPTKTFIVALDDRQDVVGWTIANPAGQFQLHDLPPGAKLTLMAATDTNNNYRLGEAGELISGKQTIELQPGEVNGNLSFLLQPSDGRLFLAL